MSCVIKRIAILAAVALALTPPATAGPLCTMAARDYVALKKTTKALSYAGGGFVLGKTYEIRGTVSGIVSSGSNAILLLRHDAGSMEFEIPLGTVEIPSGLAVRMLAKAGGGESEAPVTIIAVAAEAEVAPFDPPTPKADDSAAKGWKGEQRGALPSRAEQARVAVPDMRTIEGLVASYTNAALAFNPRLGQARAELVARSVLYHSARWGVDPRLTMAIIAVESGFRPEATSPRGAMGLTQLMPLKAREHGLANPYDIEGNIAAGVRTIRGHLERNQSADPWQQFAMALACYNAGAGAVKKYGGVPPYKETQNYIKRVADVYLRLCGQKK
jgi:soluble lytic murein transglycosylase-like protein